MQIKSITARQILDSRGNPTVEVDLELENGSFSRASVPSGASTGQREAIEIRDNSTEYHGQGVMTAISHINSLIKPSCINRDFKDFTELDKHLLKLDGTSNKSILGANATLPVSIAYAKALAGNTLFYRYIYEQTKNSEKLKIPTPMFNVINGGRHALESADIQEFMIVPTGLNKFKDQLRAGSEIFHTLKNILAKRGYVTAVGDEGGFLLPKHHSNEDALDLLIEAIEKSGYEPEEQIKISLDVAASELFDGEKYNFKSQSQTYTAEELIEYYDLLTNKYPILSIEDGLDQEDWSGWAHMQNVLGSKVLLVGDDLLVTNTKYIQKALVEKACNSLLIKPNQIGTLTQTIEAVQLSHAKDLITVMSHRSGETEDITIADLAVGLGCKYIKSGSLSRSERLAKYNQLLRIEESLNNT